ncbi:MAG: hypothetical protein RJA34_1376 [Pseudomonadota bacterium]
MAENNGLTQQMLASALRMSQAQVSRILSGQLKRRSRHFELLSVYVSRYRRSVDVKMIIESKPLLAAISEAWDGTPEHEVALAAVIRSLARLQGVDTRRDV